MGIIILVSVSRVNDHIRFVDYIFGTTMIVYSCANARKFRMNIKYVIRYNSQCIFYLKKNLRIIFLSSKHTTDPFDLHHG